jgi:hypothetical protein
MLCLSIEIHLIKLEFNKYGDFLTLLYIPGKGTILVELRTSICSYLTIYSSKGRPPKSDGGLIVNSIELAIGFNPKR